MARKTTDAPKTGAETIISCSPPPEAGERQDPMKNKKRGRAGTCESGFYIYIGPNIKNCIQTGTIYRGTRANALKQAAAAIEAHPLVKALIVSGDALPEARAKVKTPGNTLYANYKKLTGKGGN